MQVHSLDLFAHSYGIPKACSLWSHSGPVAASLALESEHVNAHSLSVRVVGFSLDGASIISGSSDCTFKVFNYAGKRTHTYSPGIIGLPTPPFTRDLVRSPCQMEADDRKGVDTNRSSVRAIAFSGDGKSVVSASVGKILHAWAVYNMAELEWEEIAEGTEMEEYGVVAPLRHWRNRMTGRRIEGKPSRAHHGSQGLRVV